MKPKAILTPQNENQIRREIFKLGHTQKQVCQKWNISKGRLYGITGGGTLNKRIEGKWNWKCAVSSEWSKAQTIGFE